MRFTDDTLRALLVEPGHITEDILNEAIRASRETGISPENFLIREGHVRERDLGKIIAYSENVKYVDLGDIVIPDDVLRIIPEAVARTQRTVVFELTGEKVKVATEHPSNYDFFKMLERKTGASVEVYFSVTSGLNTALSLYRGKIREDVEKIVEEFWGHDKADADGHVNTPSETGVIDLVDLLLMYAYENKASDIHIEPLPFHISVRFRIDGVLHEVATYPRIYHEKVVSRIKILSRLRTDEHFAAQDGRFTHITDDMQFDIRVSILPVVDGENIVMRLLVERQEALFITDLGIEPDDLEKLKVMLLKPHGMLLTVGPTGSGKTTSLYTMIKKISSSEVNVMSIEDPVEYNMQHIQQIQVNEAKDISFGTGLRSIVRQDPDVVMVGEIRDNETADIAVNAAMTGHLILSTMHTNDAATTFPRLVEMGVEPFLVASAVNMVIAQRLVRKICSRCKSSYKLEEDDGWQMVKNPALESSMSKVFEGRDIYAMTFYKGTGCDLCHGTGFSGRIGIFEVMLINDDIRALIINKAPASTIKDIARKFGLIDMFENGLKKVERGVTTLDEVLHAAYVTD